MKEYEDETKIGIAYIDDKAIEFNNINYRRKATK